MAIRHFTYSKWMMRMYNKIQRAKTKHKQKRQYIKANRKTKQILTYIQLVKKNINLYKPYDFSERLDIG